MCAIFGSSDKDEFLDLYKQNRTRGIFASSTILVDYNNNIHVHKQSGDIKILEGNFKYFAGHVQAPTSSMREWSDITSHPFISKNWMVIHNGVLTNYVELNNRYCRYNTNPVDTSTITELLELGEDNEISVIKRSLSMLEGTFALLIVNKNTSNFYLARQGSTLFSNNAGSFSSTTKEGMSEVKEGEIILLSNNTFCKVDNFISKSPFFIL